MSSPTDTQRTILILGASYAGLSITHYILKHVLPSLPDHKVIVVSVSQDVICRPACARAMISDTFFNQSKLFVDISTQLSQYADQNWTFVHGTAIKVNHESRTVTIKRHSGNVEEVISFHALVVATGASTSSPLLSNGPERAEAWKQLRLALPSARRIVIAGGGPAGVEVAGELGSFLDTQPSSEKVTITLVTSAERILPDLRPAIAATAEKYLAQLGVTILKSTKVVGVEPETAGTLLSALVTPTTVSLSLGEDVEADIYIPATGTHPNTSFLLPTLVGESGGRVRTNNQTLRVDGAGPRVYALGDCSDAFGPAIHNIMAAVPVLGANIKKDLFGIDGEDQHFKEDTRETQLVPIGSKKGVGAAMGWRLPSWMVWLIKGRDYWVWTTGRLWSGKQW